MNTDYPNQPIRARRTKKSAARGFSLLEALISILLLSVGAMGVAGLQLISLQNNKSADERSRAAALAQYMVDDASFRRGEVVSGSSNVVDATFGTQACNSNQATAIGRWRQRLDCEIPGAQGSVEYNAAQKRLIVRVRWDDSRALGGDAAQVFSLDTRL